jgi:UDP-glucose:(heptosyl)LPS alpha-1,3-glucosyltransferase
MRLAIVRKKYSFHGGAEGFTGNFIHYLGRMGHEIHIYSIQWQGMESSGKVFSHHVPSVLFSSFLRDITFALSSYFTLRRKRRYFDIIQSHDKTLFQDIYRAGDGCHIEWLKQRMRRKGIYGKLSIMANPYHWLILSLERAILRGHRFRRVIAISQLVKENIIDHYGVDERDIDVVYNGVDLEKFHPRNRDLYRQEIRSRYSIAGDEFLILLVGSGFERKGVASLLRAVELVAGPVTVMIVGRGSRNRYLDMIHRQKVVFCGPQSEIHQFYAASDVFVSPSMYEPFGNAHLEALASGLPVVTTRKSGASEIVEEGKQGFIIDEPEDSDSIAGRISQLVDGDLRRRMGMDARILAEKFSFENHAARMMRIYDGILKDQKESG